MRYDKKSSPTQCVLLKLIDLIARYTIRPQAQLDLEEKIRNKLKYAYKNAKIAAAKKREKER